MIRRYLIVALIGFAAALAGVLAGRTFMPVPDTGTDIHHVLHDRLTLDANQKRQLEMLEQRFGARRRALEAALRADNRRLATAIQAEHRSGPAVEKAIDASHITMGALQKETLAHVFAMRALLRPDQTPIFDEAVTKALVEENR